eukprot:CAMPEP_0176218784 /NCGR_PEP_ID=MMETSP0121_2-20121125/18375_1 /TAXON_ID=160619 /ORGANISM="Kryptoperidinium foliaceum, Strain CCMP 1326" /LENGTH=128 /DNA_ID=CAMNT_0017557933 /DNA_START=52 /DNA_END=438 /DNA_ORIENTATION=-
MPESACSPSGGARRPVSAMGASRRGGGLREASLAPGRQVGQLDALDRPYRVATSRGAHKRRTQARAPMRLRDPAPRARARRMAPDNPGAPGGGCNKKTVAYTRAGEFSPAGRIGREVLPMGGGANTES